MACVLYFRIFLTLRHDLELLENFNVVGLLEGVEFAVISLALPEYSRLRLVVEFSLKGPLAVHEANVAELIIFRGAYGTLNIGDVFAHFEYAISFGNDEHLFVGLARVILAVCEPRHSISYLSVPGYILLPADAMHIPECVEREI